MAGMKQFRKFVRGVLDGVLDETSGAVKQAARSAKKGTAYHAEVSHVQGARGDVRVDSEGNFDIEIQASVPLGGVGGLVGGEVTPSVGFGRSRAGHFLGDGEVQTEVRIVIVNAVALGEGVDASDPGGP